jgi:hypothetical protein
MGSCNSIHEGPMPQNASMKQSTPLTNPADTLDGRDRHAGSDPVTKTGRQQPCDDDAARRHAKRQPRGFEYQLALKFGCYGRIYSGER